jgi:ERCC4-type nuclease
VKTDFERSLTSEGRLFQKADRLTFIAENSDQHIVPVMLLEGDVYQNSKGLSLTQIDGAISFLAGVQRISILSTVNAKHSAHMILRLASAFLSGQMLPSDRSKAKPKALFEQKMNALRALPGVDEITAELLLREFGSIQALASAGADRIAAIKGIGPHKANAIARVFG